MILPDRDTTGNGTLDERVYYLQNWRSDVVALITDTGDQREQVRYEPYGTPFGLPAGDLDSDGDFDVTDYAGITGAYDVRKDVNMDGSVTFADTTAAYNINGLHTMGRGVLSSTATENRKGYAGYEHLAELAGAKWDVRNRILISELGTWNRRDPLGYVDGINLYAYAALMPLIMVDAMGEAVTPTSAIGSPVVGSVSISPCEAAPVVIAGVSGCGGSQHRVGVARSPCFFPGPIGPSDRLRRGPGNTQYIQNCNDWSSCFVDSMGWMTSAKCKSGARAVATACCTHGLESAAACENRAKENYRQCMRNNLDYDYWGCVEGCVSAAFEEGSPCAEACRGCAVVSSIVVQCGQTCPELGPFTPLCFELCLGFAGIPTLIACPACLGCAIGALGQCAIYCRH